MNHTKVSTSILGLTNKTVIELSYFRPRVRDRVIFGELVPFNKLWRTGANANTVISFSTDVLIGAKLLKKGKYALFTVPGPNEWAVIFYNEITNYGLPRDFDESKIALIESVESKTQERSVESFTIMIHQKVHNQAILEISWDHTYVDVELIPVWEKTIAEDQQPRYYGSTATDYFVGSQFYFETMKDYKAALIRIDMALEMNQDSPTFYHRLKGLIEAQLGNKNTAIHHLEIAIDKALKDNDEQSVIFNRESIEAVLKIK